MSSFYFAQTVLLYGAACRENYALVLPDIIFHSIFSFVLLPFFLTMKPSNVINSCYDVNCDVSRMTLKRKSSTW